MRDEDINTSGVTPLSAEFWAKVKLRSSKQITDSETFAWFQSRGENASQQMSGALKIYAEAHTFYYRNGKSIESFDRRPHN
ncbi:MAG: hypothetical protein AUK48_08605 [Oscillatoriales cyanobacterium CG2_30_44_21]|nr:MAG: hypothetical protein AUK48_08605 [Oscillatoriales cyanobacterium CG2_30_44_21]